jgi:hypothetical protein
MRFHIFFVTFMAALNMCFLFKLHQADEAFQRNETGKLLCLCSTVFPVQKPDIRFHNKDTVHAQFRPKQHCARAV